MKKMINCLFLLVLISLVLAGCAAPGGTDSLNDGALAEAGGLSKSVTSGENWSVEYRTVTDWGTGFNGEITISNTGTTPISNWTLSFDWASKIGSIWNARLVSSTGGSYVIEPPSWNPVIPPGSSLKIGINGSGPLTGGAMQNVKLTGEGIIVKEGYENFDSFVANLKVSIGQSYLLDIFPLDGSSKYIVNIEYDPTLPRPTLLGLFSHGKFTFTRTKSNLVIVDADSFTAVYQGFYSPGIDCALMLEGIRLFTGETLLTSKTMSQIVKIIPQRQLKDRIYFSAGGKSWMVTRYPSGKIELSPAFWINDVNHDAFMKGLQAKLPTSYMARSIKVPTVKTPATWTVEVASIIDTIIPGRLETMSCQIFERDMYNNVEVAQSSVKVFYNPKWWNFPQPDGRVLFTAMNLYLEQTGVKSFYEYEALALMAQIEMIAVTTDGKKFSFTDPEGKDWTAFEENGKVILKQGF